MKRWFFYITVMMGIAGCQLFDMNKAESKKIVGNLYVVNLHLPEHPGFFIVFQQKSGYEKHLLQEEESIDYFKGNDSVLLIKTKANPAIVYYKIVHDQGEHISSVQTLSGVEFDNYVNRMVVKYEFVAPAEEK